MELLSENRKIETRILVLLYRLRKSDDSFLGYKLCENLVQKGYHLLVTTTAKPEEVKEEEKISTSISQKWSGSISLVKPQCNELEEPSPKWIATKMYKKYFGYIIRSENLSIHTIIGTLPGTTKTGVDLTKILKSKLILLATTKVGTDELGEEVIKQTSQADEIWSVGPDLFLHYNDIFHGSSVNHKQVIFKPEGQVVDRQHSPSTSRRIASIGNKGNHFYFKGRKQWSHCSNKVSFEVVGEALASINEINKTKQRSTVDWCCYGLKSEEGSRESIILPEPQRTVGITSLRKPNTFKDTVNKISSSLAFIVPDVEEDTFDFMALISIWKAIPTFVPRNSSVGKLLTSLRLTSWSYAVVNLTGNPEEDKQKWINKIRNDLLDVKAKHRAEKLSKSLRNEKLWEIDLSSLESEHVELEAETKVENRCFYFCSI